jgi:hypothetical protein
LIVNPQQRIDRQRQPRRLQQRTDGISACTRSGALRGTVTTIVCYAVRLSSGNKSVGNVSIKLKCLNISQRRARPVIAGEKRVLSSGIGKTA